MLILVGLTNPLGARFPVLRFLRPAFCACLSSRSERLLRARTWAVTEVSWERKALSWARSAVSWGSCGGSCGGSWGDSWRGCGNNNRRGWNGGGLFRGGFFGSFLWDFFGWHLMNYYIYSFLSPLTINNILLLLFASNMLLILYIMFDFERTIHTTKLRKLPHHG